MTKIFEGLTFLVLIIFTISCEGNTTEVLDDNIAPSAPTNLVVKSSEASSVNLIWSSSTDNNKVKGYYVYSNEERTGILRSLTYAIIDGLEKGVEYRFTVTAVDEVGNESAFSNEVVLVIPKTVPTGLALPRGITDPTSVDWNEASGVFTFRQSVNFSSNATADNDIDGFYWEVPQEVKKIIVDANVTITGGFRFRDEIIIEGVERSTSRIFGTNSKSWALGPDGQNNSSCGNRLGDDRAHDCEKWNYGAISSHRTEANKNAVFTIRNLTLENPRTYAITTFDQKLVVDNVHIVNTREGNDYKSNSDGIGGGAGTVISNTKIDTWDDGVKLYRNTTLKNVTIIHNANGAPLQLGWGAKGATQHSIDNVKIISAEEGPTKHNLTAISASLTSGSVDATLVLEGKGLAIDLVSVRSGLTIRTGDPLPLVWLKSSGAKLSIDNSNNAPLSLHAPNGEMGLGEVVLKNVCGATTLGASLECNTSNSIATGASF